MDRLPVDHANSPDYGAWHSRLIAGDAEAAEGLATMLLRDLPRIVRSRPVARLSDPDAIGQAIDESIEHYLQHPTLFSPGFGHLVTYLARSAENRLKDWRTSEARRHRCETEAALALPSIQIQPVEAAEWPDLIAFARPLCTEEELGLLRAVVDRKSLAEKAAALGLQDGSSDEQRIVINRIRERLVTRLRRHARRLGFYFDRPRGSRARRPTPNR